MAVQRTRRGIPSWSTIQTARSRAEGMYEDNLSLELSIPDESINFDLVYSLHSFAAMVEGRANVVKGDSLILMDDGNNYWWLVKEAGSRDISRRKILKRRLSDLRGLINMGMWM